MLKKTAQRKKLCDIVADKCCIPVKLAGALVLAGEIEVNGVVITKPGVMVGLDSVIKRLELRKYVSRGGIKLSAALDKFNVLPAGKVCIDVGSSTGGFTDCLLQRNAERVYAVDVGYGLIDVKLRNDKRVVLLERTNARMLNRKVIELKCKESGVEYLVPSLAVIDVAFISLRMVLTPVSEVLSDDGVIVALLKPQFEVEPRDLVKGIVRDVGVREKVVSDIKQYIGTVGLVCTAVTESVIKGAKGNVEYLLHITKGVDSGFTV
ncbi:MAG: TlyA family RNA methyltransferase [Elusimicrobiota bacterium]